MNWFYYSLLSAFFAALTAIFAKIGLEGINSDFASLIRTVFIVLIMAIWVKFLGAWQGLESLSLRQWLFLFLSACATGFSWLFYFKALQLGQASQVAPIDKFSVVLVAIFGVLFLGERLNLRQIVAISLIFMGIILMAWEK